MDAFEINKFMGAFTGALALFLGITFITEGLYHSGGHHGGDDEPLMFAEAVEPGAGGVDPEPEVVLSLAALMTAADPSAGARVFRKCSACHKVEEGGSNGIGPALWGVMGRDIGAADGFNYSAALSDKGGAWTWEAMNGFLEDPKGWAPGTKMNFAGLRKPEDRAALMAYLNAQTGAPIDPPVEEAAADAPAEEAPVQ